MTSPFRYPSGFYLHQSHRLEDLRDQAIDLLRRQPVEPLKKEVILVQSNGIAQWLKLSLASTRTGCGIAAGLDLVLPARFQWQVYRDVLGYLPIESPFDREFLLWRLMRLIPNLPDDTVFDPLRSFVAGRERHRKLYQLCDRVAGLFDQYQVYRADWLVNWSTGGNDLARSAAPNSPVQPVPTSQSWQPALWRRLLQDIPEGQQETSRAHVHLQFLQRWRQLTEESDRQEPSDSDNTARELPPRIMVFGISSLPHQLIEILWAIQTRVNIHVFVHCPERAKGDGHPLVDAWGKQGSEYLQLLSSFPDRKLDRASPSLKRMDSSSPEPSGTAAHPKDTTQCLPTLLQQLQEDMLAGRSLQERRSLNTICSSSENSIRFHVAHSPQREVEILHDQLLDGFQSDPSLEPRDVMVMVPDIDRYAPHIQAVFGQPDINDPNYIPYTLSDQSPSQHQGLQKVLKGLLQLPESHFTVSELQDWLEVPAFRQAAGWSADELGLLNRWLEESGIRWGLNQQHRQSLGITTAGDWNTWRFGLRRLLLGYATGGGHPWLDIEPTELAKGLEAAAVGHLYQLITRLEDWSATLRQPHTLTEWLVALDQLLNDFFSPQTPAEQHQWTSLRQVLQDWARHGSEARFEELIPVAIIRDHWLGQIGHPHLSQRFLGGAVNFATLMPMRAIPFKRICLLGMNDGDFPRQAIVNELDLMSLPGLYRPGDRSRADDDRYLFLEAVLSARESLYVSWVGRSNTDNSPRPPSVLVGQLRDHLSQGWSVPSADGETHEAHVAGMLTTYHPLQPFSRDYFSADGRLFTYAGQWRAAHHPVESNISSTVDALTSGKRSSRTVKAWDPQRPLSFADLQGFLKQPVEAYFYHVLQIRVRDDEQTEFDHEPFTVEGLDRWTLTAEALNDVIGELQRSELPSADRLLDQRVQRWQRQGRFPHPPFSAAARDNLKNELHRQLRQFQKLLTTHAPHPNEPFHFRTDPSAEANVTNAASQSEPLQPTQESWQVADEIDHLYYPLIGGAAPIRVVVLASDLKPEKGGIRFDLLLAHWTQHIAGCHQWGQAFSTYLIHRGNHPLVLTGFPSQYAVDLLHNLIEDFHAGMQGPLPVATKTAIQWLTLSENVPVQASEAIRTYEGGDYIVGEASRSPLLYRCFPTYGDLVKEDRADDFRRLARRLYQPLIDYAVGDHFGDTPDSSSAGRRGA